MQQRIDKYEIRGFLGEGGNGSVHRAWDPDLNREIAIKPWVDPAKANVPHQLISMKYPPPLKKFPLHRAI